MPKPEPRPLRTLPERAFRARARLVAALMCCVCFAGLAARLAYLQLFAGGWYTNRALGQQLRDTVVPADRGRIYSADGVLLAANSSCWTLRASPREMPEEKLSLAAQGLAEILELDEAKLLEKFSDRTSNDCLLRYRVERDTADRVRDFCEENSITGIRINQDSKRWYPQGAFLASVLGFTNVDNAGVAGLELKYDDLLTGENGVVLTAVNAWGYTLEQSYETERFPTEGDGLRLGVLHGEVGTDGGYAPMTEEEIDKLMAGDPTNLYFMQHSVSARTLRDPKVRAHYDIRPFGLENQFGVTLKYDFDQDAGQKITCCRFSPDGSKLFIGQGEIVCGGGFHRGNCTTAVFFRVADQEDFFRKQCLVGNHVTMVYGDYKQALIDLADVLGVEAVVAK